MSESEIVVRFAGSAVRIEWDCELAESLIEFIFGSFQRLNPDINSAEPHVHFKVCCHDQAAPLLITGSSGENFRGTPQDVGYLLMERVTYHLADHSTGGLLLHAACMARNRNAVALPGVSGSGKSTLALWLEQKGYDFLTDELVFIPEGTMQCLGFTRPMNLKNIAGEVGNDLLTDHILFPSTDTRQLVRSRVAISSANLRFILFPRYKMGARFTYQRLSGADAALALTGSMVNARNLPDNGFPELLRLVRAIPAYRMEYESFESVGSAIESGFTARSSA